MPVKDRLFDPVQIAHADAATAGLEGAVGTAAGGVLLWGWLLDPARELDGLGCSIGGRSLPIELLDRTPRPDLQELLAASTNSRPPEPGFVAFAQADEGLLREAGGRITLEVRTPGGEGTSGNRLIFEPGSRLSAVTRGRLPTRLMRPDAIRRVHEAFWRPEAARAFAAARRDLQIQQFGRRRAAGLSLVIPAAENTALLRQTLSYLDMDPEGGELEVVLAVTDDAGSGDLERMVHAAATDLTIRIVRGGGALSVGGAARLGLEAATAPMVVLMSDAVVPPARGWVASTLEHLTAAPLGAPSRMPRFDGLVARFEPRPLSTDALRPHDEVRGDLQALSRGALADWSPGLIAGSRAQLLGLDLAWGEAADADAFWAELLAAAVRGGAAPLSAGGLFTLAPLAVADTSPDEALLELYGLHTRLLPHLASPQPVS